jgi:cyclic pyranopterin phosphate synthase
LNRAAYPRADNHFAAGLARRSRAAAQSRLMAANSARRRRKTARRARLSHLDAAGRARMVDVADKSVTLRRAQAEALVTVQPATLRAISAGALFKGDVLAAARLAGIQAAKRTHELIPLCHPLPLDAVRVDLVLRPPRTVVIIAEARVRARTGVEMEALTAAAVAALTLYDMCKSTDRGIVIGPLRLIEKSGGRSGRWRAAARGRGA